MTFMYKILKIAHNSNDKVMTLQLKKNTKEYKHMTMTHYYSICNGLALLVRINGYEGIIEYRYSDETEVKTSKVHYDDHSNPYFNVEGSEEKYYLDEFCRINM